MVKNTTLAFLLLLSISGRAQWQQLPGPGGGLGLDFAYVKVGSNDHVFMATDNGVWLSSDTMRTWSPTGLQGRGVTSLLAFSSDSITNVLFAASGTYRNGAEYYWLFSPQTLFRSIDGGKTWDSVAYFNTRIIGFGIHGRRLITATNDSIFASSDLGVHWIGIASYPDGAHTTIPNVRHAVVLADNAIVSGYFVFSDSLYYAARYNFDSNVWSPIRQATKEIIDLWISSDSLFMGGFQPTLLSTDRGLTWSVDSLATTPGKWILGQWMKGAAGGTEYWYDFPDVLASSASSLAVLKNSLFAISGSGVYRSTDRGMTWIAPHGAAGLQDSLSSRAYNGPTKFYLLGDKLFVGGRALWVWNDSVWSTVIDTAVISLTGSNGVLIAGLVGNYETAIAMRSTDAGRTWKDVSPPQVPGEAGVAFLATYAGQVYSLLEGWYFQGENGLFASSNFGDSWQSRSVPDSLGYPWCFFPAKGALVVGGDGGLWSSRDSGISWVHLGEATGVSFAISSGTSLLSSIADTTYFNMGGSYLHLLARINSGQTSILASSDSLSELRAITKDDEYVYLATTSRGIWRAKLNDVGLGTSNHSSVIAEGLSIHPNPSTEKTIFSFDLPERSYITLKLYDTRGTLCATIFTGEHEAGDVTLPFSDPHLANGIYEAVLTYSSGSGGSSINRAVGRLAICR